MALVDRFGAALLARGKSERTVKAYLSDVKRYVDWCETGFGGAFELGMLNAMELRDFERLCRGPLALKASTWNRTVASLRLFCGWLEEEGLISVNPSAALSRAEGQKLAPKSLNAREYRRLRLGLVNGVILAESVAARRQAARDLAVVTLLAEAGLREGEVVNLRVVDLLLGERKGRVVIRAAKGNKDRDVPLPFSVVQTLSEWLKMRGGERGEWMFDGKFGERLQQRGIQRLVGRAAERAGIGHVTPHQLRHTAAYRWIKAGAGLGEVAELLGHSTIEVTRRYSLPHWEDLEALVEAA